MSDAQRCPDITRIGMESGVSAFTGAPFVKLTVDFPDGSSKAMGQMTPEEVRQHALQLLETAEAAVHDAAMAQWLRKRLDADPEHAAAMVADIREFRADQPGSDRG
jgi:hypothetical protein